MPQTTLSQQAAAPSPIWTIDEAIGRTVARYCMEYDVTRKDLGAFLGVQGATVGKKIRGIISWYVSDLIKTAEFFHAEVSDFLPIQNPDWNPGDDEGTRWLPAPVKPPKN